MDVEACDVVVLQEQIANLNHIDVTSDFEKDPVHEAIDGLSACQSTPRFVFPEYPHGSELRANMS